MTAEVVFAKTFLSVLDTKPIKLQPDYAADLRTLEITFPYTLPRYSNAKPMIKATTAGDSETPITSAPGSEAAVSVWLKSLKNPPLDISLPAEALSTSVLDLKQRVAKEVGLDGVDKIRLLWKKKPIGDSKSLKEIISDEALKSVELGVMIIGGVPDKTSPAPEVAPVATGESGADVLKTDAFWSDLQGFLEQRLKDQAVAEQASKTFREAWQKSSS